MSTTPPTTGRFDDDASPARELSADRCLEALRSTDVGRLAIAATPWPEVFPVNFAVDHGTVVFRTGPGTKLLALTAAGDVTFEADGYDAGTGEAWSVVIKGTARDIAGVHDRVDALELPLFPVHRGPKHHLVRIEPVIMTGRRFAAAPADDARRRSATPDHAAWE